MPITFLPIVSKGSKVIYILDKESGTYMRRFFPFSLQWSLTTWHLLPPQLMIEAGSQVQFLMGKWFVLPIKKKFLFLPRFSRIFFACHHVVIENKIQRKKLVHAAWVLLCGIVICNNGQLSFKSVALLSTAYTQFLVVHTPVTGIFKMHSKDHFSLAQNCSKICHWLFLLASLPWI